MPYASEKRQAITAIFMVFLFILSEVLVAENDYQEELEDLSYSYSIYNYSPSHEVHISSQSPNSNFIGSSETRIGLDASGYEDRSLYRFSNNLSKSNDVILSAQLKLTCNVVSQHASSQTPILYPATLIANFAPSEVTWNSIADFIPWQIPGADGNFDREDWDVPSDATSITTNTIQYNLNVTKLVQNSLDLGRNKFDIIVSGLGGELECAKSNNLTSTYHPELIISHSQGIHGDGGLVEQDFAVDGAPLMKDDFILSADTFPTISYKNLVGSNVQFQFSLSNDFRNVSDSSWLYSTMTNSFSMAGQTGSYDVPASEAFPLGSKIHYRIRSIDNTSFMSDWASGLILLPDYNTVDNNDGTATISLSNSEFSLAGLDLIEDTYIDSREVQNHGDEQYLYVNNDVNGNTHSLIRVNLGLVGIHSNSTILQASVDLDRQTVTPTGPELSLHPIDDSSWDETEATWNYGKIGQVWTNGGVDLLGSSETTGINSNAVSNVFSFDIQNSVQEELESSSIGGLSFALTGYLPGSNNPNQLEEVRFSSSESQGLASSVPRFNITYAWTNNQSIPSAQMNHPVDSSPVWEIVNDNLSGDTTPVLDWQSSDGNFRDYRLQVSSDHLFRNLVIDFDSRVQGASSTNSTQNFSFSTQNQLSQGEIYHWRVKQIDGDDKVGSWNSSSFFVSELESEWLGGDFFKFVINNSIDSNVDTIPGFKFSSIGSNSPSANSYGYPYLYVADTASGGKFNALLSLGLRSYALPTGYAVISSNISMTTSSSSGGSIDVGVWELLVDDWNEQEVTWLESSSGIPWESPGASGTQDRVNLLSTSSVVANCCTVWNVTSAVQNSMRDGYNPNFMFEMMANSYGSTALFHSPQNQNPNFQPQLEIIFTLGSSQKPTPPNAQYPANGEWVYKNNSTLESVTDLTLSWSHNNPMPIVGWAVEIDSANTFDSVDKRTISSWNNPGFDVALGEYELQSALDIGKVWHWRIRGLSNTYQLGEWSQPYTFYLPDLNFNQISSNSYTTTYSQGSAFTNLDSPKFTDLHITDSNTVTIDNGESDSILTVGKFIDGANSSILISVPIPQGIQPQNASVTSALISLEATSLSSTNVRMAIREVLVPWDTDASNTKYDATNNWSELGARGIGSDVSEPLDIIVSQVGENQWDITQTVQLALSQGKTSLSLIIYTDADNLGDLVYFYSSESQNTKPTINMTWVYGQRNIPSDVPYTISPTNGQVSFNQTSHAVLPELRPIFTWSLPQTASSSPDAWKISFQIDPDNDMAGKLEFDSRINPNLFDLNTLSFSPDQDIDFDTLINWSVQPIEQDMIGYESNISYFLIPTTVGQELNQTDATLTIQDGNMLSDFNFPHATKDTYLDQGNPTAINDLSGLAVGNSSIANTNTSSTTTIIDFNWSMIDMPSVYEIISAELTLTALSGSGEVDISASRMLTDWDENSTWSNSSSNTQWINQGALRGGDSDLPDSMVYVAGTGTYTWNITRILQIAVDSNQESASILLQPELINSADDTVNGNYIFADSEHSDLSLRPKLSVHYRTTESWLPPAVSLSNPVNGQTLWNETSPALVGADNITFEITQPISNYTTINLCHGKEIRWLNCVEVDSNIENYTWDSISNIINYTDGDKIEQENGDDWHFWRVRVDQDHRIGHYSSINQFRIPELQTVYDGLENYQLDLYRGSVFLNTGDVPTVIDASTDSSNPQNIGTSNRLSIGTDTGSGGVFDTYFEFNLSDLFFVPTATPISMTLELEVSSNQITQSPMSVALYACDSFDELLITSISMPNCSSTEITRTSLTASSGNIATWDFTSLGQTNFFTNNDSISFKLTAIAGQNNFIQFHSSESNTGMKPKINLTYIENLDQYMPPAQPLPVAPQDGEILYDTTSLPVSTIQSVQLEWSQVSSATSYQLFIKSNGQISVYDSINDLRFNGNTFTGAFFNPGSSYEWWVQGFNQSIPGPPSQKWTFGLGNPLNTYQLDGTYRYLFSDSSEVYNLNHFNVQDTSINSANIDVNYGFIDTLIIGGGCGGSLNSVCDAIVSVDTSQLPLDSNSQSIHSINLTLSVESWDLTGGAYEVDFSVHEFLYTSWDEMILTWNNTGVNPGPQPGVDYVSTPLDQKTYSSSDMKLSFEVSQEGQAIGDVLTFLIRGTPISGGGNFDGFVSVYSSDYSDTKFRPEWAIYHTNVSSLNITSQSSTYNADNSYTFDVQSFDSSGASIVGGMPSGAIIEWTTTSGSITNTGPTTALLSPTTSGSQTISACYGIICTDYTIYIDSGQPVQIFASLSEIADVNYDTITADETISVSAYAVDQYGNLVTSEVISFTTTNGTVNSDGLFSPYATGIHTITAEWIGTSNTLQEDLQVEVTPGVPVNVQLSGCNETLHADTSCDIFGTAFDQYNNLVWFDDVGEFTLGAINGDISQISVPTPHTSPPLSEVLVGEYTGDIVGEWEVTFSSLLGISDSISINVTHGAIQSFELESSATTITADDKLYLNTTRIDVRGNRLSVTLPIDNWTSVSDGQLVPGLPAIWYPSFQGTKSITATYQGYSETIEVFVSRGIISELNVIINEEVSNGQTFYITADDEITASILALDANGNQWLVDGNWSFFHPNYADENILSSNFSQEVIFSPVMASTTPYTIDVEHTELDIIITESFVVYVSVGDVENFNTVSIASSGVDYTNVELFEITADDFIQFSFTLTDFDLNQITNTKPSWTIENVDTGELSDITQYMEQNALIWQASEVGMWQISSFIVNNRGFNLTAQFDISVSHGTPVNLALLQSVTTQDAGNFVDLQVTGTDSDGNQFPQAVVWLENNGPSYNINATDDEGIYQFNGRSAGNYTLTAEYLTLSNSVYVDVFPLGIVKNIKSNISAVELEQLEVITVQIDAYDLYWNKIPVPDSARIDTTDRGDVKYLGDGVWELSTLDEGEHSATIVIGSITETFTYNVEGNLAGFFAAGGPLYYVGAGLLALIIVALLVFVIRLFRGDEDYYDDDEDEDYYQDAAAEPVAKDFSQPRISQAPTVPTPPAQPPTQEPEPIVEESEEAEDTSWMADYRVDDEGTEWGQTEDGVWYYRESGSDDWIEWTE